MTAPLAPFAPHHGLVPAPLALPRAATFTDLLLGRGDARSCGAGPAPTPDDLADLGRWLERRLAALAKSAPGTEHSAPRTAGRRPHGAGAREGTIRVTGYLLRTTRIPGTGAAGAAAGGGSFAWSPTAARRFLGLAAVRRCVAGTTRSPAEAVVEVTDALVADGRHGLGGVGSLAGWLGGLPHPALAVVEAEAITWATRLWTALEWGRLGHSVEVGGAERHWAPAGAPSVSLRRRVDVRVDVGVEGAATAFLTMLPGWPGATSRVELGLAALVAAVSGPPAGVPQRVAGWWPDSGRAVVVPVDRALLEETATAVVRAVATVRGVAAVPGVPAPGAAGRPGPGAGAREVATAQGLAAVR